MTGKSSNGTEDRRHDERVAEGIILPHAMKLSRDFYLWEFTRSRTAEELGIEIVVYRDSEEHLNLEALTQQTLQPVRDRRNGPLITTSGYRPPKVNRHVGGVATSDHVFGRAWDGYDGQGMPAMELMGVFLEAGVPFDELILEHDQNVVHVSYNRRHNKGEVMTRWRRVVGHAKNGRPEYELDYINGIHALDQLPDAAEMQ